MTIEKYFFDLVTVTSDIHHQELDMDILQLGHESGNIHTQTQQCQKYTCHIRDLRRKDFADRLVVLVATLTLETQQRNIFIDCGAREIMSVCLSVRLLGR